MKKILYLTEQNYSKIIIIYFVVQLLLVFFWREPFKSDSYYYYKLAEDCISLHSFYPAKIHLYEDFITAPLYINLLVVVLSVYNSQISVVILNVLINALQLFLLYKLTLRLFDKRTAVISVLIYIFYLNSLGMVLMNLTEFLFGVLTLSSIYFFYKKSYTAYFLSGLLAAASIAVRPLGWALAAAYLISILFFNENVKNKIKIASATAIGLGMFIFAFGILSQIYFGEFIYTATNGPVNILIGANDNATGAYNTKVFEPGKLGFIPDANKKTYIYKENIWKQDAKEWILSHPVKWIGLFPVKTAYMFFVDDFAITDLFHADGWYLTKLIKEIIVERNFKYFGKTPVYFVIPYLIVLILSYIYYFSIGFILIKDVWKKKYLTKMFSEKFLPATLFVLIGLTITIAAFGSARFRYPYMMFFFIAAAAFIKNKIDESKMKIIKQNL